MIFGWLQKRFTKSQTEEASSFLRMISGADQGVLDIVCGATIYWAVFYRNRGRDLYEMETWIPTETMFPVELTGNIKGLQRQGTTSSVPGLMVWLHSARGLLWPELRLGGRQIWVELSKAGDDAVGIAEDMCIATKEKYGTLSRLRVPSGLDKLDR